MHQIRAQRQPASKPNNTWRTKIEILVTPIITMENKNIATWCNKTVQLVIQCQNENKNPPEISLLMQDAQLLHMNGARHTMGFSTVVSIWGHGNLLRQRRTTSLYPKFSPIDTKQIRRVKLTDFLTDERHEWISWFQMYNSIHRKLPHKYLLTSQDDFFKRMRHLMEIKSYLLTSRLRTSDLQQTYDIASQWNSQNVPTACTTYQGKKYSYVTRKWAHRMLVLNGKYTVTKNWKNWDGLH